jgi:replicative DNA helicase
MELSIIKSLMNKEFYDDNRGSKCPHKIFSKDIGKIKTLIDAAMEKYHRDLTVDEVEGLFFASDPLITPPQRNMYKELFNQLRREKPIGNDVANEILSKLFQRYLGEEISNIGFRYVNGTGNSLEPLRNIIEGYRDDFLPDMNVEWDDLEVQTLLDKNDLEAKWHFNIPTLAFKVEGVNAGHLVIVGARPNTGKTSFHASMVAGPKGFAEQGANCIVLCNEEGTHRVGARYLTAASGMTMREIRSNPQQAQQRWNRIKDKVRIKDATGQDMFWVESVCKTYKPDVLILDMGDKFTHGGSYTSQHEALKACAIHTRQIAKEYGCAVFYMSQLSADAEGKIALNQSMMEGSKTGKASEADLMLLISKNPTIEGQEEAAYQRHINLVKNKLSGWHGYVTVNLNYHIGRYEV